MFSISKLGLGRSESEFCYRYMASQAQSPSVGGAVKGLPREGESKQQLSVLGPSRWEQLLEFFNFGAGLWPE